MSDASTSFDDIKTPEPKPQLSAGDYFVDSFKAEADRQITGVAQLFGNPRKSMEEAPEATSVAGYNAQLLGRAAADLVPMTLTALAVRFGVGRFIPTEKREVMLPGVSIMGIHALEGGLTGAISSGVFKESDASTASVDPELIKDRVRSALAGGVALAILAKTSGALAGVGSKAEAGSIKSWLKNPIVNGIVAGVPAGGYDTLFHAFDRDKVTTPELIKNIYENAVFGAFSTGIARITSSHVAREYYSQPEPGTPSFAPEHFRDFNVFGETTVGYRRYLSAEAPDAVLDAMPPEQHWKLRADELSERIASHINEGRLSKDQFWKTLDSYPKEDQPIAQNLLERSAALSTDYGLTKSLYTLGASFKDEKLTEHRILAEGPESSATVLAYLMRKTHKQDRDLQFIANAENPKNPIIFANLENLGEGDTARVLRWAKKRTVTFADTDFDRLPNIIDFSVAPDQVKLKLDKAIKETKTELIANPDSTINAAVERALHGPTDQSFAKLVEAAGPIVGQNLKLVRPGQMASEDAFRQLAPPQAIRKYIENFTPDARIRTMTAELLADNVEFNSFGTLMKRLQNLRYPVEYSAAQRGLDPANDIFAVAPGGWPSSEAYMTFLYAKANGIATDRIKPLSEIDTKGEHKGKRVLLVEDAIYSGEQMTEFLRSIDKRTQVAAVALSSYDKFAKEFPTLFPKTRELLTLETDFSLSAGPYKNWSPVESGLLSTLTVNQGYGKVVSTKVLPHMTSDSTPQFIADLTHGLLKIPTQKLGYKSPWRPVPIEAGKLETKPLQNVTPAPSEAPNAVPAKSVSPPAVDIPGASTSQSQATKGDNGMQIPAPAVAAAVTHH